MTYLRLLNLTVNGKFMAIIEAIKKAKKIIDFEMGPGVKFISPSKGLISRPYFSQFFSETFSYVSMKCLLFSC